MLVGQNSHRIRAFNAASGTTLGGFPQITDGYQFLSSSTVAKVASNQILAGTGLGLLHAYDGLAGRDTAGFPKVTGGWLFAPAALSDAPACQSEWPSFRRHQQGTGDYDADGTPPAAPDGLSLTPLGGAAYRLQFRSPGDDGFCGTATRYLADVDGQTYDLGQPAPRWLDKLGAPGRDRAPDGLRARGRGFSPVVPQGGSKKLAKPRLKLVLKYRKGRISHTARAARSRRRTCALSSVRVTVAGADRGLVRRARLGIDGKLRRDRKPRFSRVFKPRHGRKSYVRRVRALARLRDGRLIRLSRRLRICPRH